MGTGAVPQSGPASAPYPAANALWVLDPSRYDARPETRDDFVAWPPPGYFPYQLSTPRWSFSYPGADFSNAAVTMTRDRAPVPVALEPYTAGYGESTLVWVPANLDASYYSPAFAAA